MIMFDPEQSIKRSFKVQFQIILLLLPALLATDLRYGRQEQ